ncbi:SIN3-associated polypeptide 30 [Dermatophagoides pteronyssinus]|uniref:SIN3-associated polypeptide 30 n=1 Tax=Dermatophagoides pteronyssinus TaxID=6956 RepID=UPI003F677497
MGINPQQQQSNNNSSINYQITTINPPTTTTTLNGGNIGSTIISSGGGGGNIIGTINNLVNMNLTSVSVSAATPSTITTTTTASTTITNNPNTITTIATTTNNNNNNNALSLCCLIENGTKCTRNAGNASYSKRIEKQVAQRKLQLIVDPRSSHAYICEHHKQIIQSIRTNSKRKRKDVNMIGNDDGIGMIDDELSMNDFNGLMNDSSNEMIQHSIVPSIMNVNSSIHHHHSHHHMNNSGKYGLQHHQQQQQQPSSYTSTTSSSPIDFHSLQVNTLRKYKRHFRLPIKHASNKNQLADEIQRHFRSLDVNEKDVINKFMYMVKNGNNNNNNSNNNNGNGKSNEFNNSKE